MKEIGEALFHFTKQEKRGLIALLVLILGVHGMSWLYRKLRPAPVLTVEQLEWFEAADTLEVGKALPEPPPCFPFDPNTLDAAGWTALGLPAKVVRTIGNYRAKGGRFRKADDLARIYGLHAKDFARIKGCVRFKTRPDTPTATSDRASPARRSSRRRPPVVPVIIEVNAADSAAWTRLPGIGPVLSRRIVAYRRLLGGFHRIEQLGEVYGVQDSLVERLRPRLLRSAADTLRKIDLNMADVPTLAEHPYISYALARQLTRFRDQRQGLDSLGQLREMLALKEANRLRISPYLRVSKIDTSRR